MLPTRSLGIAASNPLVIVMYILRDIAGSPGLPRALKALNGKTVQELRQLCKDVGAPTTGAKADLVSRLGARVRSGGVDSRTSGRAPRGGVDSKTRALLDPSEAARALGASVARLAKMVDDDWFSSHDETRPELLEWARLSGARVEAALRAAEAGRLFEESNDVLKVVADTWCDINCIPFRTSSKKRARDDDDDDEDSDSESSTTPTTPATRAERVPHHVSVLRACGQEIVASEIRIPLDDPDAMLAAAWSTLCARAAARETVSDSTLNRFLRDAIDHGVAEPHEDVDFETMDAYSELSSARARLWRLHKAGGFRKLPSTKIRRAMRAKVDRRARRRLVFSERARPRRRAGYDGSPARRTRSFSSYFATYGTPSSDSEGDSDCPKDSAGS